MIAELKKTQSLADTFEFVRRESQAPRIAVRRPCRSTDKEMPKAGNSVWIPLPKNSAFENLCHGVVLGVAAGAIAYGLALSFNFAEQWNVLFNWVQALVR
jgi:hypothetical protein